MEAIKEVLSNVAQSVTGDAKSKNLEQFVVKDPQEGNFITTNYGVKQADDDNTLKAAARGPSLLEDFHFREKMTHFDHERIPERVVHARGAAAHGYFQCYESLGEYTAADFLNHPNKKTPVFVRFSTVLGSRGAADTVRDVRGFATKFYTDEGNFDLVGNNIPVFFIQDAIKFPDIIHAGKPEPHNEIPQGQTAHDNFWDFISLQSETTHMIMWALSDRAIPRSYRMMQGFGVHTFILTNKEGKRRFVKFHWVPVLGTHSLVWDEAMKLNGVDPDFHRRDLWEAIESGAYPEYELKLQVLEEEDEHKFDFDILDATKIIPEEIAPLKTVGKMVLNRNPDNYFAETEQVAYCTSHLVPGIETSNDPLLQGRHHSYVDTQITRLGGPNFEEIPINRPVCPVTNNQRDGFHRMTINRGRVNYYPNRFGCPAVANGAQGGYVHSAVGIPEAAKLRARGPKFAEHFRQARLFYNSLADWEKKHVIAAAQFELGHVDDVGIRERMIDRLNHVDFDLATQVAVAIGVNPPKEYSGPNVTHKSPPLSQENTAKNSIKSRKVALLLGPGYNAAQVKGIKTALEGFGAMPIVVGPHKGKLDGGDEAQFSYFTTKSIMFDAVILVGGNQYGMFNNVGETIGFVNEAFKHCKPIVALDQGADWVATLNFPGINVAKDGQTVTSHGVVTSKGVADVATLGQDIFNAMAVHRHYERDIARVPC